MLSSLLSGAAVQDDPVGVPVSDHLADGTQALPQLQDLLRAPRDVLLVDESRGLRDSRGQLRTEYSAAD